jgi:hypothetical protein
MASRRENRAAPGPWLTPRLDDANRGAGKPAFDARALLLVALAIAAVVGIGIGVLLR